MSRVARAARVASRQRIEVLGNGTSATTNKTITAAETGELYYIDHNHGSELLITLPPKQDGAYFKFVFLTNLTAGGGLVKIISSEGVNGDMVGSVFAQVTGGSNADSGVATDNGSRKAFEFARDTNQGSYLECYCDGTTWVIIGHCNVSGLSSIGFSV